MAERGPRTIDDARAWLSTQRRQYRAIVVLSIGATAFTALACAEDRLCFARFIGHLHPLATIACIAVANAMFLSVLLARGWFTVHGDRSGVALCAGLAPAFGLVGILIDLAVKFPADLNVALPQALFFYPAIAYVAETVFHALPLALLSVIVGWLAPTSARARIVWTCILVASLWEPLYQAQAAVAVHLPPWAPWCIGLHVWLFNMAELYVFKRYDFVSMFALRVFYYLVWHVAWGHVRLRLLFDAH